MLTDGLALALVLDVIVAPGQRGCGHGRALIEYLLNLDWIGRIRSVELVCQPDVVGFYDGIGFSTNVGASLLMRRTKDPLLSRDGGAR